MSDDPSPWPESERTQRLLFAAGALLLVPVVVGLADLADIGGAVVVICATLASALLVYGLLGWAGTWVEGDRPGDAPTSGPDGTAGDAPTPGPDVTAGGDDAASGESEESGEVRDNGGSDVEAEDADAGDTESGAEGAAGDQSGPDA